MSVYGIASFADGFIKGRGLRLEEQERKDQKARQAKMDELLFAREGREAEVHAARMDGFSREKSAWERGIAAEDRALAEEAARRAALEKAYEAAKTSYDAGQTVPEQGQQPPVPNTTPPAASVILPPPQNHTAAALTGPGGMSLGALGGGSGSAGSTPAAPPPHAARAEAGAAPPPAAAPVARGLKTLPNGYSVAPAPSAAIADELYRQGPAGVRYLPPAETPKEPAQNAPGVMDLMQPNYGSHTWGSDLFEDLNEVGRRSFRGAQNVAETVNDGLRRGANNVNFLGNKAMGFALGPDAPQVPYFTGNGLETSYAAGEKPGNGIRELSEAWDTATTPPKSAAAAAATDQPGPTRQKAELMGTAQEAMAEAATPAVKAAADATAKTEPAAMGVKPGQKVTPEQRDRAAGSFIDHYMKVGAPLVIEDMLKRGDYQGAIGFQAWMDGHEAKAGMKSWAKAAFAASVGDMDTFADEVANAYNRMGYFPDGTTIQKDASGFTYGKNGEITGAKLTFRDEATGNTFEQVYSDPNDLVRLGITLMAPENAYAAFVEQTRAASGGLTPKDALDAQNVTQKRIDDAAKVIFEQSQNAALTGGTPLTYEQARAQAEAAILGLGAAPQSAPSDQVPVMRRPAP